MGYPLDIAEVAVGEIKNSPSSDSLSSCGTTTATPAVASQPADPEAAIATHGYYGDEVVIVDRGLRAWSQVLAAFLINAAAWGSPSAYGAYQAYYTTGAPPDQQLSATQASWIGSLQTFLTYFLCAVSGRLADAGYARQTVAAAAALAVLGTLLTSMAAAGGNVYWQLLLTQGLLTGTGLGLVTAPSMTVVNDHFRRNKSIALALATTGTSAGSAVFPAVVQYLVPLVGFVWAVRCSAFVMLLLLANAWLLLRPRPRRRQVKMARTAEGAGAGAGERSVAAVAAATETVAHRRGCVEGSRKSKGKKMASMMMGLLPDLSVFREPLYVLFTAASFLIFWALYFGFFYVSPTPLPQAFSSCSICRGC